jgi:starch phosphorylase
MRVLMDVHGLDWNRSWLITRKVFSYTNHTLMPEALESWPVALFEGLLPRHLQIIYEINQRFLDEVRHRDPGDVDKLRRLSIIDEDHGRRLRMAHLAIVGSHTVNGVSAIHTELMKTTIFAEFHALWPDRIINITNGITPRRWLKDANPRLAELVTSTIGDGWVRDLNQLARLRPAAEDPEFRQRFRAVKHDAKVRLAERIHEVAGVRVNPASLFDVQIKRIHEYKRQLLNVLHVITRYNRLRAGHGSPVARTVIFAGKAAPGYAMAKLIIRLIHAVADVVNFDPAINDQLKLVFLPNYNVSNAEKIIPAADLSEQISTAGTEASGTGNMKLALNGALTIGTLDGANIEIREQVGADHIFTFGLTAADVAAWKTSGYDPRAIYDGNAELRAALDMIRDGYFSMDDPGRFRPIVDALLSQGDYYMLLADYADYVGCQDQVDSVFREPDEWSRRAILNVAAMGHFSADRAIQEYATRVWGVRAVS